MYLFHKTHLNFPLPQNNNIFFSLSLVFFVLQNVFRHLYTVPLGRQIQQSLYPATEIYGKLSLNEDCAVGSVQIMHQL